MTTAHETTYGQSSSTHHWPVAAVTYGVVAGLVATVLTTVTGESLAGFTTVETAALAAGSTAVVAAVCWYVYIDRRDPDNVRRTAESTSVFVGIFAPFTVWIGFVAVALPGQLVTTPGVTVGMGLVVAYHSVVFTIPVSFVVATVLGRLHG